MLFHTNQFGIWKRRVHILISVEIVARISVERKAYRLPQKVNSTACSASVTGFRGVVGLHLLHFTRRARI